jgi:putative ABC transport system permease protein
MRVERWLYTWPLRLRSLFRGRAVDKDLDDEIGFHVDRLTAEHIGRGLRPAEARLAALRAMNGIEQRKEECRDTRKVAAIESIVTDLRYGARILRRSPGFTTIAVLSLAIGIGANTAIFQLIDAVRVRGLPVTNPHELAIIQIPNRGWPPSNYDGRYPDLTYPQWDAIRASQRAFSSVAAWSQATFDLAAAGESRFAEDGLWVSGEFFNVLGVRPMLGRVFTQADDVRGCGAPGVVLSHAFWRREFGASPLAIGATLTVGGRPLEVIGVTARGFFGVEIGRSFDLALPLCAEPFVNAGNSRFDKRAEWWLSAIGRLNRGWSLDRASSHLASISPAVFQQTVPPTYGQDDADKYLGFTLGAVAGASGFSQLRQEYDAPLWMLLAAAGIGLLIACANLANLMLARMAVREREMAVRLALGASRARLVRQLLIESLLLAAAGAACGAVLAPALSGTVVALMATDVSPMFVDLTMDWRLLAFAAVLAALTCVLFGLAPALRGTRVPPGETMKAGGRTLTAGRRQLALRRTLVAAQMALSLVLLVCGLLFSRSFYNLITLDTGFQQDGILEVDVDLTRLPPTDEGPRVAYRQILERVRAVAGVEAVATAGKVPLTGRWYQHVFFQDRGAGGLRSELTYSNRVGAGYFDTLRIAVSAGRDFDARDVVQSPRVVIVNEAFARSFLPNAVGATFKLEGTRGQPGDEVQVVGVVRNTTYANLREEFKPIIYLAESQSPIQTPFVQCLIRGTIPPGSLRPAVARAIAAIDPRVAFHFHDFQAQIRYSLRQDRLMATLCGFFAALGALLATIGVYGVITYSVTQRTSEIGLRVALGADRRAILALVLREAGVLIATGLAIGAGTAAIATRAARAMLYGLQPGDPATLLAAIVILSTAAAAASYLPARRAARVDPMVALRCE